MAECGGKSKHSIPGNSVHRLLWALSEGGAISGFDCICVCVLRGGGIKFHTFTPGERFSTKRAVDFIPLQNTTNSLDFNFKQ